MGEVEPSYQSPAYTWYPETEFCYMTNKAGFSWLRKVDITMKAIIIMMPVLSLCIQNTTPVFIDAGVGTYISPDIQ